MKKQALLMYFPSGKWQPALTRKWRDDAEMTPQTQHHEMNGKKEEWCSRAQMNGIRAKNVQKKGAQSPYHYKKS